MRIVIDMHGAQAISRFRGIGRYIMGLAEAMAREAGEHEIVLVVNGNLEESCVAIQEHFRLLLPQENIVVWYPVPYSPAQGGDEAHRVVSEAIYETFFCSLNPDVILIPNLFEWDGTTSVHTMKHNVLTAVILYDLTYLIYGEHYLTNSYARYWAEGKIEHLKRADVLLSLSEASRQDMGKYLSYPLERIAVIHGSIDARFGQVKLTGEVVREALEKYGINRKFILYTGGWDWRKNVDGLLRGFSRVPKELRDNYQLVIVYDISNVDKLKLEEIAKKEGLDLSGVVFTGFVSDEDLLLFYNRCALFVFPSIYEGFPLPVLEAMACGAPTIVSHHGSMLEEVGRKDMTFDPHSNEAIAQKITEVLTNESYRKELSEYGKTQVKKFSWKDTAQRAIRAVEDAVYKK